MNSVAIQRGDKSGLFDSKFEKVTKWFILSAGGILFVTSLAKIVSAFGSARILHSNDPIFGISFRNLMLTVGALELLISLICLVGKRVILQTGLLVWLATCIVIYRLGLFWLGYKKPCSCLGNLTDALHISPQVAGSIMKSILIYLLIGSYSLLFYFMKNKLRSLNLHTHLKHTSVNLVVFFVFVFQTTSVYGDLEGNDVPPFTVEATTTSEMVQANGFTNKSIEKTVFFSYSNGWWEIESKYKNGFVVGIPQNYLVGSIVNCKRITDGIRYINFREPQDFTGTSNQYVSAIAEPTTFPPPEMEDLLICWLSLCPNPSLPIIKDHKIRRLVSVDFLKDKNNEGDYLVNYLGPTNGFLSELCITNNGVVPMADGSMSTSPAPFNFGYQEFSYKVLETTNFNGVLFPLRSVLSKYVPKSDGKTAEDLFPVIVTYINVQSIEYGSSESAINASTSVLLAFDRRLTNTPGDGVKFLVTNDVWPAITNSDLVHFAAIMKTIQSQTDVKYGTINKRKQGIIIIVLLVMTLGPLLGLMLHKIKTRK
jgi:hypothetical protein